MIAIGVDVGGTNLRVGAVDPEGDILLSLKEPTPQSGNPEALLHTLTMLIGRVQKQIHQPFQGVGLGWPGPVELHTGQVSETPNIRGFQNFPLQMELEKRLHLPCLVENDAKCAGLAEKKFGVAQSFRDFLLLTFGTGIGGAIFVNGELLRGNAGMAGEIGHLCLHPKGIPCACGSHGCFEKYVSAKALEARAQEKFHHPISAPDVLSLSQASSSGSELAQELLKEYVQDLAWGLGSLINIFAPEAIVFSGGLFTTGGGPLLEQVRAALSQQGFQSLKKNVQLLASNLEGKAGIVGAASLILGEHSSQASPEAR